jgi:iron(III) transport system permease protein
MRQDFAWITFSLAMLVYLFFFLIPLGSVIKGGFFVDGGFTLKYITGVFTNPIYREGLLNSLLIGLGTTLLATAIALPLAWIANRFKFPLKGALTRFATGADDLTAVRGRYRLSANFRPIRCIERRVKLRAY